MRGEEERWHRRVNGARAQREDDTVGVWVQKDERLHGLTKADTLHPKNEHKRLFPLQPKRKI